MNCKNLYIFKDRFNDEDEMYAWGGTQDNISNQQTQPSYQNSTGYSRKNMNGLDFKDVDSLIASSTRQ